TMMQLAVAVIVLAALEQDDAVRFNPALEKYIQARAAEFDQISDQRKRQLDEIARYARGRLKAHQVARLKFICTHNSRRSQLAQIWAKAAAEFYGVRGVDTFSGGTEATAFNPRAVSALKRAGFHISVAESKATDNPRYRVRFSDGAEPMKCFSKVYGDAPNPQTDFAAVLTCSQADAACPLVVGASLRVALPYDDPKAFDGTSEESD